MDIVQAEKIFVHTHVSTALISRTPSPIQNIQI